MYKAMGSVPNTAKNKTTATKTPLFYFMPFSFYFFQTFFVFVFQCWDLTHARQVFRAQMVQDLPSKHKAPVQTPVLLKDKNQIKLSIYNTILKL
jgi:hypothetical protein